MKGRSTRFRFVFFFISLSRYTVILARQMSLTRFLIDERAMRADSSKSSCDWILTHIDLDFEFEIIYSNFERRKQRKNRQAVLTTKQRHFFIYFLHNFLNRLSTASFIWPKKNVFGWYKYIYIHVYNVFDSQLSSIVFCPWINVIFTFYISFVFVYDCNRKRFVVFCEQLRGREIEKKKESMFNQ